jgi:hypothetical protein
LNAKFVKLPGQFSTTPQGNNNNVCQILKPDSKPNWKFRRGACHERRSNVGTKIGKKKERKKRPKVNALLISQNLPHLVE